MREGTDVVVEEEEEEEEELVKSVAGNATEALCHTRLPPAVTRDMRRMDELHVAREIYLMIAKIEGGEIESGT